MSYRDGSWTIRFLSLLLGLTGILQLSILTVALAPGVIAAEVGLRHRVKQPKAEQAETSKATNMLLAMTSTGKSLGLCPLRHTSVDARISGYVARVTVKQIFENTFKDKIEAVYTFPLSDSGAVDSMVMEIGDRTICGEIKKREEAKQIYEQARSQGRVASLLDQERTNIFTQSVANIEPGKKVEITLQYVELLPFEEGKFSFIFPTVVGPRFIPGMPIGKSGSGRLPDTTQVPDASLIAPPVSEEGTNAGHNISIDVNIDAGMPISNITSKLYEVRTTKSGSNREHVSLLNETALPNKDFVLTWEVAQENLQSGYLVHKDHGAKSGYFSVMLVPPKRVSVEKVGPKEMIFLIDCSGSQSGLPLQKAKETMLYVLDHMNPHDTFQIIAFSNHQTVLFEKPELASAAMRERAVKFINSLQANGGTWMAPAVEKACAIPTDSNRLRIVTFMTDGYVGNDYEIIAMIRKLRGNSRWFSFGTGNSVNRMLIDGIASEGGGEADYILLNSSAAEVGKKFYDRISSPVLTDVKIAFEGLDAKEIFPSLVSDVWAHKPLFFKGRYDKAGRGKVIITGFAAGRPYKKVIEAEFPAEERNNSALGSVWARAKVDRLMANDLLGVQIGAMNKELKNEIIATALEHHIMTQFTSFVAVDSASATSGKAPRQVTVPVELPEGVSRAATIMPWNGGGADGDLSSNAATFAGKTAYGSMQLAPSLCQKSVPFSSNALKTDAAQELLPAPPLPSRTELTRAKPSSSNSEKESITHRKTDKDIQLDTKLDTKLDSKLQELLKQYRAGQTKPGRNIQIEITLDKQSSNTVKRLNKVIEHLVHLKLHIISVSQEKVLSGSCTLADLEEIIKVDEVKSVKLITLVAPSA